MRWLLNVLFVLKAYEKQTKRPSAKAEGFEQQTTESGGSG